MEISTILRHKPLLVDQGKRNRHRIVMVATLGGALMMFYKCLEQATLMPELPTYQSTWCWSAIGFSLLFFGTLACPGRVPVIGRLALTLSFTTHIACYVLSFTHTLGLHELQKDSILAISRWNTLNYMVGFSVLPMQPALVFSACIYTITTSIWLYFIYGYASYDQLGLTIFDLSTFLLTGIANLAFCIVLKRMASLRERERTLAELAVTDSLTGLANRLYLEDFLQSIFPKRQRESSITSIALCDIDSFKKINDTYSHSVGDDVLRHFATILRDNVRSSDIVGRYGGEEFLLIFLSISAAEAAQICDSLRIAVENYDWTQVHPELVKLTVSFGISDSTEISESDTGAHIIHQADLKMYRAKKNGRNQVCV